MSRLAGIAVVFAGVVAYLAGFATDHLVDYDDAGGTTQRFLEISWDVSLLLPLVAVGVATHLWPRWRLVLSIGAFALVWPLVVHAVEVAAGLAQTGDACDPCVDTTILSVLALPALVIGGVSAGVARRRGRRRPGAEPARGAGRSLDA